MTPYYADELVTLYQGDCLDVLPLLPQTDLIFTSPPYNLGEVGRSGGIKRGAKWRGAALGAGYEEHGDAMPYDDYKAWQQAVVRACWERLTDRGALFYNHKPRPFDRRVRLPLDLIPSGLPVRQIVVWARPGGMNFAETHYLPTHEWIVVVARDGFRLRDRSASGVGDVWTITPDNGNAHPASFPVALPARAIETVCPSLVIDPFTGSGSTLVAAKAAGVRAIGVEISERYCEMAVQRLAQGALNFGEAS